MEEKEVAVKGAEKGVVERGGRGWGERWWRRGWR